MSTKTMFKNIGNQAPALWGAFLALTLIALAFAPFRTVEAQSLPVPGPTPLATITNFMFDLGTSLSGSNSTLSKHSNAVNGYDLREQANFEQGTNTQKAFNDFMDDTFGRHQWKIKSTANGNQSRLIIEAYTQNNPRCFDRNHLQLSVGENLSDTGKINISFSGKEPVNARLNIANCGVTSSNLSNRRTLKWELQLDSQDLANASGIEFINQASNEKTWSVDDESFASLLSGAGIERKVASLDDGDIQSEEINRGDQNCAPGNVCNIVANSILDPLNIGRQAIEGSNNNAGEGIVAKRDDEIQSDGIQINEQNDDEAGSIHRDYHTPRALDEVLSQLFAGYDQLRGEVEAAVVMEAGRRDIDIANSQRAALELSISAFQQLIRNADRGGEKTFEDLLTYMSVTADWQEDENIRSLLLENRMAFTAGAKAGERRPLHHAEVIGLNYVLIADSFNKLLALNPQTQGANSQGAAGASEDRSNPMRSLLNRIRNGRDQSEESTSESSDGEYDDEYTAGSGSTARSGSLTADHQVVYLEEIVPALQAAIQQEKQVMERYPLRRNVNGERRSIALNSNNSRFLQSADTMTSRLSAIQTQGMARINNQRYQEALATRDPQQIIPAEQALIRSQMQMSQVGLRNMVQRHQALQQELQTRMRGCQSFWRGWQCDQNESMELMAMQRAVQQDLPLQIWQLNNQTQQMAQYYQQIQMQAQMMHMQPQGMPGQHMHGPHSSFYNPQAGLQNYSLLGQQNWQQPGQHHYGNPYTVAPELYMSNPQMQQQHMPWQANQWQQYGPQQFGPQQYGPQQYGPQYGPQHGPMAGNHFPAGYNQPFPNY